MNRYATDVTVLGLNVAFKPGADMERIRKAVQLVEDRFAAQKARGSAGQTKDILLTFLALGLADDVLQAQKKWTDAEERLAAMLEKIAGVVSRHNP